MLGDYPLWLYIASKSKLKFANEVLGVYRKLYEGEIVGELDPKKTTQEELGLYMAGAKRDEVKA